MQMKKILSILCVMFTSALFAAEDYIVPFTSSNEEIVAVKMWPETKKVHPGKPFWMCVAFEIAPDWHLYWKNPGDAGAAPSIVWTLPKGFRAGDALWPAPEKVEIDHSVVFGYSRQLHLLVPIFPPNELPEGSQVSMKAEVQWLGCSTICVPGNAYFTMKFTASYQPALASSTVALLFKQARKLLPQDASKTESSIRGDALEITVKADTPFHNVYRVYFFPETPALFDTKSAPTWKVQDDPTVLKAKITSDKLKKELSLPFKGVIVVDEDGNPRSWNVLVATKESSKYASTVSEEKKPIVTSPDEQAHIEALEKEVWYRRISLAVSDMLHSDFLEILLFAFLGGIILNFMPCVLPVISLKLLHFVQLQGYSRRACATHGLIYSLGVLLSFWVLAGTIIVLQYFGKEVGWGFQLQNPLFVAILFVILFMFSLSLFGVFEFFPSLAALAGGLEPGARLEAPSATGSFLSGVLATFVASPCTGPLLGSAIGFAATLEPLYSLAIFTALALGLAFPFLLLSFFPGLARFMPRPGRWMNTFKQLMGFLLLVTVLWLGWVLDSQVQGITVVHILTTLLIISFGLWVYGTWGALDRTRRTRIIASILSLVILLLGVVPFLKDVAMAPLAQLPLKAPTSRVVGAAWEPFSVALIEREQKESMPLFVSVTAKWCLTCQANHVVLESQKVKEAFIQYGIKKLEADWTNGDLEITRYIRSLGRNGVPLEVVYSRDPKLPPKILPEVLTADIVIDALKWANDPHAH